MVLCEMPPQRIELTDGSPFDEREWLRRELLWASLMTPYSQQMNGFVSGAEIAHHFGNASRADLYATYTDDAEAQSKAFLNMGKKLAGILSGAALFRTTMYESPRSDNEPVTRRTLQAQCLSIDIALGVRAISSIEPDTETDAFLSGQCLAAAANTSRGAYARRHYCLRAAKIMTGLAVQELPRWRKLAEQDEAQSLPTLLVADGGTPRSAGPRVKALQPIFQEIVGSSEFAAAGTLH